MLEMDSYEAACYFVANVHQYDIRAKAEVVEVSNA
jgi:hypothetical protein